MRIAITAVVLMLTACGNWSNEDIEYLYALPQKETLKSKLTAMGNSTQQPLVSVGDPSKVYDDTKKQSDDFNAFIDGVLGGLDAVRMIPPTRRDDSGRYWGPYPDSKNPGFDVMVEIHRESDMTYSWSIKMRPRAGSFVTIGGGTFKPTDGSLRKGQGTFFFDGKASRALLMNPMMPVDADRVDFGYATDVDPVIVNVDFQYGAARTLGYAFNGYSDKSAVLQYVATDPSNLYTTQVSFDVYWDAKTAGSATYLILKGTWAGAMGRECWDEGHLIVFGEGYDENGYYKVGDDTKCVDRKDLLPLP